MITLFSSFSVLCVLLTVGLLPAFVTANPLLEMLSPDETNHLEVLAVSLTKDTFGRLTPEDLNKYRNRRIVLIRELTKSNMEVEISAFSHSSSCNRFSSVHSGTLPLSIELFEGATIECRIRDKETGNVTKKMSTECMGNKNGFVVATRSTCRYFDFDSIHISTFESTSRKQTDSIKLLRKQIEEQTESIGWLHDTISYREQSISSLNHYVIDVSDKLHKEFRYSLGISGIAAILAFSAAGVEEWYYLGKIEARYRVATGSHDAVQQRIAFENHALLRNTAVVAGTGFCVLFATQCVRYCLMRKNARLTQLALPAANRIELRFEYAGLIGKEISACAIIPLSVY